MLFLEKIYGVSEYNFFTKLCDSRTSALYMDKGLAVCVSSFSAVRLLFFKRVRRLNGTEGRIKLLWILLLRVVIEQTGTRSESHR